MYHHPASILRPTLPLLFLLLSAIACEAQKRAIHTAEQPLKAEEAAATMAVPEGFRVTLFAGEPAVRQPIGFCIDDRNRLWVAEAYNYPNHGTRPGADRIVILEDVDGDGRHDSRKVFFEGLNYVSGIEVGFGGVWVMSPPFMYFIADRNKDDVPDSKPQVLLDGFGNHANAHNMANGFAWGPDGWLYATHGRTNWSMIGKPGADETERERFDGGVWRYHPVRHEWEPYADGTTNPWGIDWNDYGDAFVCNCVNPHLFQVIQGAHYEPWRGRESSKYAYQRIDTIADHLHFVGLGNVRNGLGSPAEDNAGGGHAHCGTMIYLGDQFPSFYRNQLFTNNIHGRRINNDLLHQVGSGYVASHGPDLMRSRDPWFMGVTLAYGAGGEVYVSDWSDTGECHSTRNTRRETGRIYRLTYLESVMPRVDLSTASNEQLVDLQMHANDWYVRHARRLLHERSAAGDDMTRVHDQLRQLLDSNRPVTKRLRALWTLHVTGGNSPDRLRPLLDDRDPNVRAWAVRLLCENGSPSETVIDRFARLAREGSSPRVRLAIASALQRIEPRHAMTLAPLLAGRGEDAEDVNLPLMIWYGAEPLIEYDLAEFAKLAGESQMPRVSENVARRIASSKAHRTRGLDLLITQLSRQDDPIIMGAVVRGMLLGLESSRDVAMPRGWPAVYRRLVRSNNAATRQHAIELALRMGDRDAEAQLRQLALNGQADAERRREAIAALVSNQQRSFDRHLIDLLQDPAVRTAALHGLRVYQHPNTAAEILRNYPQWTSSQRQAALQTLASRSEWAQALIESLRDHRVAVQDVTALTARQIHSLGDARLSRELAQLWGEVRETPQSRARQISSLQSFLTPQTLADADLNRGQRLFAKHCGTCHRFFGSGGELGPDLTGAQRTNLAYLLENIIDPNASVSNDYRMHLVRTVDGRVISGLVETESDDSVTIVTPEAKTILRKDEIEARKDAEVSIMPEGLLEPLSEREIRDLMAYLQR